MNDDQFEWPFDRNLSSQLLMACSRFEHSLIALKRFRKVRKKEGLIEADRKAFACEVQISKEFQGILSADGDLSRAHETLMRTPEPPRRLQRADNENGWEWADRAYESGLLGTLEAAFQVRNNIAHGGKYFDREPTLVARADELIRAAIVIVVAAARCDAKVNATFTGKEWVEQRTGWGELANPQHPDVPCRASLRSPRLMPTEKKHRG
jgi:hypothetical protein